MRTSFASDSNARGGYDIKFVLEAGLSESYDHLVEDARLWLEGMRQVSLVGLIYKLLQLC